jgi:hypothetical protein
MTFEAHIKMTDVKPHIVKPRYFAQCVEEFEGYIDYFSGHGHAFVSPDALGCVTLQCWPTDETTWQEIAGELLEDSDEIQAIDEGIEIDQDAAFEAIRVFVEKTYLDKDKEGKPFPDWKADDDSPESPTYLIVLHIFEETT